MSYRMVAPLGDDVDFFGSLSGGVADARGKIIRPKLEIGEYGFIAFIQDTEGIMLGLRSLV